MEHWLLHFLTGSTLKHCSGLPQSGKKVWKMKNFPGLGKSRGISISVRKFRRNDKSQGKVCEFKNVLKILIVKRLLKSKISINCKKVAIRLKNILFLESWFEINISNLSIGHMHSVELSLL